MRVPTLRHARPGRATRRRARRLARSSGWWGVWGAWGVWQRTVARSAPNRAEVCATRPPSPRFLVRTVHSPTRPLARTLARTSWSVVTEGSLRGLGRVRGGPRLAAPRSRHAPRATIPHRQVTPRRCRIVFPSGSRRSESERAPEGFPALWRVLDRSAYPCSCPARPPLSLQVAASLGSRSARPGDSTPGRATRRSLARS